MCAAVRSRILYKIVRRRRLPLTGVALNPAASSQIGNLLRTHNSRTGLSQIIRPTCECIIAMSVTTLSADNCFTPCRSTNCDSANDTPQWNRFQRKQVKRAIKNQRYSPIPANNVVNKRCASDSWKLIVKNKKGAQDERPHE